MLTVRKAALMVRHQTRQKRGGGRVLGESGLQLRRHTANGSSGLVDILGKEPTPESTARFADTFEHLMNKLSDATLKTICAPQA